MVKLIIVKNPFQPYENRVIKTVPNGFTLRQMVEMAEFHGVEINCVVNGETIEMADNYVVPDNNMVVLSPVVGKGSGGKILGMVVGVALMVVGGAVAAGAFNTAWGMTAAAAAWTGMGIGLAGSLLIGYTQSAYVGDIDTNYETSTTDQTYSWNGVTTMEGQDNPVCLTYGTVKSGGQTIGKYVTTSNNNEYLNWLVSAGEGELTFSDIQLNDNPISYYSGVTLETRSGTNTQTIISNFNDTYSSKSLGYQLLDGYRTETCQGNATQGIKFEVEFSNGLYYANDSGGLDTAWVDLDAQYRIVGGSWVQFVSARISAAQSSALRVEYRVDNLTAGEYEVRLRITGRSHEVTNSRAQVRCYWSTLTSIVYDDFCYPCTALIGIKALATDQISGSPNLTFLKTRSKVWVWNPNTSAYEQRNANNPAWASYDMLHLASRLQNVNTGAYEFEVRGVPANHIIYEQFKEWADFCDSKQLYVNIEITQCNEMLETINGNVAKCGRGTVMRFGTRYGCVWNCVKQPVQMFGMGNISNGTMQEEFLQTSDRANCVELTYVNADHDYERETITIYGETYDTDAEEKTSQVTYNGITSYSQAYREGKFQLYCNQYQLRTVSFEANIDAIACTIGDVILVSHDVPQWAYSGRIYNVDAENNQLTLPVEINDTTKSYRIMYRTVNDVLYTSNITILSNADGWCTVQCATTFDANDMPQANDIFDIAVTSIGSKPFIVKSITRASDFTRKIECLEYNENLYNENYTIPAIEYSLLETKRAQNVTRLNAKQTTYKDSNGNTVSNLDVSWQAATNGGTYTVLYSTDNANWKMLQSNISGEHCNADVEYGNDYYVKVVTTLGVSKSSGVTVYAPKGADVAPPNVTRLSTELLSSGTRRFWWDFEYPTPNDIAGFKLKFIQGNTPNWELGHTIQTGLVTQQPFEAQTVMQGEHCIMIKAVDNAGNESEQFASCIVDFGEPLKDNVLWESDFLRNGSIPFWKGSTEAHYVSADNYYWAKYDTNGELTKDGYIRSKQSNNFWYSATSTHYDKSTSYYWNETYSDFYFETYFMCPVSGAFYLLYDVEGIYNLIYYIEDKDTMYKAYSTKIEVKAGDIIHVRFESKSGTTRTILKKLTGVIDVPDRQEHFENISISKNGTELPIVTPNYYTVTVAIDSIETTNLEGKFELVIESKKPCVVRFEQIANDAKATRTPIDIVADITWQGFEKEEIS